MENQSKVDRIFELLPKLLNARADANWSSIVKAIGSEDERLAKLIEEVRKQFFINTASRPYLDRLGANYNVSRPRFVGMNDKDFRRLIPILAYQPKQVKRIIDELLDLFFLKDATTAFLSTSSFEPFYLEDGWAFDLKIDNLNFEHIVFKSTDFTDISNATAEEIAAAYNRQAKYSYAISFYDSVTKLTYVRFYTNTIGAQGSMNIQGGLSCIGLKPNGFLNNLGTGNNTQWNVTKIGNIITFTYNAGTQPGVENLLPGDIFLCDITNNKGSFVITDVDLVTKSFSYENLLGTSGTFTQTNSNQTKWLRPVQVTSYISPRRALAWETTTGAITVEMPATPPVVSRRPQGGFHINGSSSLVDEVNSSTSLTVVDSTNFPESGYFVIEPVDAITANLEGSGGDTVVTYNSNGRVISDFIRYHYTELTNNTLLNITPNLPTTTSLNELTITNLTKSSGVITATVANNYQPGDTIFIKDSSGILVVSTTGTTSSGSPTLTSIGDTSGVSPEQLIFGTGIPAGTKVLQVLDPTTVTMSQVATASGSTAINFNENTNGPFEVITATPTQFTVNQLGTDGAAGTPGIASKEQRLLALNGFKIIIMSSTSSDITGLKGPYIWDLNAPFTLSADTSTITNSIVAGKTYKLLEVDTTNLPDGPGYLVLDYGQNNQEGPFKYLYKAAENILAIDPSYTFQQFHSIGTSIVVISKFGHHTPTGFAHEYPPYMTNPPDAREILQELITSVASVGIFIDFIIRYPNQLYGTINVYD